MAVHVCGLSFTVTVRLDGNSAVPDDSLSNHVNVSLPRYSGSCCQLNSSLALSSDCPGPATGAKLDALPPSCHWIAPVARSTSYVVHVSRASISSVWFGPMWTALMWNESHGLLAELGSGCSLWLYGM